MPVVIGAKYDPYSFEDMLKPLAMAQQEYNAVQEGLSSLTDSSNQFSRYLDGTQAGERVKAYNAAIDTAVNDMAKNGLRSTNRDTLLGLKRQYNNDIAKINQSAAQLDTLYKGVQTAQMQAAAKGDRLFVANMPNVDDLLANPSATPLMVSGAGLQAQGMNAAKALVAQSDTSVEIQALSKEYNNIVQRTGYGSAAAQRFLQDAASIPALAQSIQQIKNMYGVQNLGADEQSATQYIVQGMFDGLSQKVTNTPQQNPEYQIDLAYRKAYAEAAGKAAGKGVGNTNTGVDGIYSTNFLTQDGHDLSSIQKGVDSLRNNVKGGGFSSAVFGKTWGRTNPMKAYEEYKAQFTNTGHKSITGIDTSTTTKYNKAEDVAKKYGATRLLTEEEYDALKDLGYTSANFFQKAGSYNNFKNNIDAQVDDLAHNTAIYNINGSEANKRITERILQNADLYGAGNSDATLAQEFEMGKKKGNVDITDLRADMEKGAQFTLGLNKEHGLVITSSIGGKQYVIAPELISTETKRALAALPTKIQQAKAAKELQIGRKMTKKEETDFESLMYQLQLRDIASSVGVDITQVKGQTDKDAQ